MFEPRILIISKEKKSASKIVNDAENYFLVDGGNVCMNLSRIKYFYCAIDFHDISNIMFHFSKWIMLRDCFLSANGRFRHVRH